MHKIVVTRSGKPCYIGGEHLTITAFDATGKIDDVVEEFEVSGTPEEIEQLRSRNNLKDWRKRNIRKLYKRGENKKEDDRRDGLAKASIRLPVKQRLRK